METAMQEEQHAKLFFKFLEGGAVEITAMYPAGVIGNTLENLEASASGENEEWTELYPEFARIADEEGFKIIAAKYRLVAKVEEQHEKRYRKLAQNIKENKVFESDEETAWVCRNCGHVHKGKKAPANCPTCDHPQAYFEKKAVNY